MTAAEQQISGNPAAMENAQARTTVTDQAKVQDIISRMDRAHETPMFHRIVTLVAAGMLMDSIDVYIGSAVASSTLATRWSWRPLFVAIGLVAAIIWWLRRDIPESPRWLAVRGRYDEADAIVKQLEANGSEPIDAAAKADTSDTRNAGGRSLGICLLVAVVAVAATNVCSYAFTSWVPTILVKRGINLSSSLLTSTVMMLGAPVGCLIGSLLIDRIGRKRTIVPAFLFTGVFGLMYAFQTSTVSAIIVGFLLMMCLYVLMASVVAVYAPELFATKVRFRCVGFANAVAKLLNVLMPMVVGWMLTSLGATSIFVAISAIAIASMLIVGFFGAETAQKSVG